MRSAPVTLDEHLSALLPAGKARADLQRLLDEERARYKDAIDAAQSRADHAVRTLRDQFAMAALTGLLANDSTGGYEPADANRAYVYADVMLRARDEARP